MPDSLLTRLGLKFKDPVMEKADRGFKMKIQDKLFFCTSAFCLIAAVSQIVTNYILGFDFVLIDTILAGAAILAFMLYKKLPWVFKIFYTLYLPGVTFQILYATIRATVKDSLIFSCYMGNFLGIAEVIFLFSFRKVYLRILLACLFFVLKMFAIRDSLEFDDSTLWSTVIFLFLILNQLYHDKLERENFKIIYEAKQTLEKFQTLLSNDFPSNVLIVNNSFNSVLYSNQSFKQKFGSEEAFEKTDSLSFFFKQFQIEPLLQPSSFSTYIAKGDTLLDFVQRLSLQSIIIQPNDVIIIAATFKINEEISQHFEIRLRKIAWEGQSCFTIILNDLSDKHLVTALKYADEQKERVIATVSHELRTPINGILGLLEMVTSQIEDHTLQTYLQHCKSCSKLLLYLVNSILDLSQIRHNKLHIVKNMFSLDELLEEMRSLYLFQCQQKGIEVIIKKATCLPKQIYTDKYRLIEILINLLSNAFKFTSKGSITLSVSLDESNPKKMHFSVEDTGLGIKDEDKPKLFQMFGKIQQQNKNVNSHGAGLGLTIADSLVKTLNDDDNAEKLNLQSEYLRGSVFSFRINYQKKHIGLFTPSSSPRDQSISFSEDELDFEEMNSGEGSVYSKIETLSNRSVIPITHSTNEQLAKNSLKYQRESIFRKKSLFSPIRSGKFQWKKVLLVDDNPFNLLTASFLIERQGAVVDKALSGEVCLDLLKKSHAEGNHYDLILMDIQMPIQDGIQTSKIISSYVKANELYNVPIVALTANKVKENELREYKESGMIEALEKPLKEDALYEVMNKYVHISE